MKNKQNLFFTEQEKEDFVNNVMEQIKESIHLEEYDCVLIPETKNECFKELVSKLNIKTVVFRKTEKTEILQQLETQKMMKAERKKLVESIENMEDIKIGLIAANQRMRVANLLFKINENIEGKKVLFMDDSVFTGSTFKAIQQLVNFKEAIVLFSNQD